MTITIDLHQLLALDRKVAVVWSTGDVQGQRPDLSDDQAWDVLQACRRVHDCNLGFTWDLIDHVAESLYPEPKLAQAEEDRHDC